MAFFISGSTLGALIFPAIGLVIIGLALRGMARAMPVKTRLGAEEAAKWNAFRRYLANLEKYENLEEAKGRFEQFLPYATAFGLDQSFIQKFASVATPVPTAPVHEEPDGPTEPPQNDVIRIESPMVGTFYRAPQPGAAPFVEEGDTVETGQTLCILEAMKLMNEVKAESEGIVRRVCVENAAPVQYGDLLFELDPLNGRPLDAL